MNFDADKQTLDDLSIFPNPYNHKSVFELFNNTKTLGANYKLTEIFSKPLTNVEDINDRIKTISYFLDNKCNVWIDKQSCDFVEFYLKKPYRTKSFSHIIGLFEKVLYTFNSNNHYYVIEQGVSNTLNTLNTLLNFFETNNNELPKLLNNFHKTVLEIFNTDDFRFVKSLINRSKINAIELTKADRLFRYTAIDQLKILLNVVYELDVFVSISTTAKTMNFTLPVIKESDNSTLVLKDLFHPFITNAIANSVEFDQDHNLCFVTGTNMAGKSTFLKSVGMAIYLAQLGFPVPASYMETSLFDGLITTINIADNIDEGHSHFYSEVLRVKHVATKISESQNVFVIFDELFRGTNVKDAYDASLAIITAFAKVKRCFFIVSTHIVEVANELQNIENINFRYMETVFEKDKPAYSYKLKKGITEERLGMWIVKNEGIVEIIEEAIK